MLYAYVYVMHTRSKVMMISCAEAAALSAFCKHIEWHVNSSFSIFTIEKKRKEKKKYQKATYVCTEFCDMQIGHCFVCSACYVQVDSETTAVKLCKAKGIIKL